MHTLPWLVSAAALLTIASTEHVDPVPVSPPLVVGHRGLLHHAPENTLAGFAACLELRVGFELDIRRTKDGHLVCLHDDTVRRTTDGQGYVADLTLAELRRLDAGSHWYDSSFAGEKVPTLEGVFALLKSKLGASILVALDIKVEDDAMEGDVARLAHKHGVTKNVVCIGLAITKASVRSKLKAADKNLPVARLAAKSGEIADVLTDKDADWVYVRFVPTPDEVKTIHATGKRIFLSGPLVAGNEPAIWNQARAAGVDALLTDYPLECRKAWRPPGPK